MDQWFIAPSLEGLVEIASSCGGGGVCVSIYVNRPRGGDEEAGVGVPAR